MLNMRRLKWSAGLVFIAVIVALRMVPAFAENILSKAVNDPTTGWTVYGPLAKSELVKDTTVTGGIAERVTLSAKGTNPWDSGGSVGVSKPVAKGDVLLLAFWARANQLPPGSDAINIVAKLQENAAPYLALSQDTPIFIGTQWKLYYVNGTASKDYPPQAVGAALQLATGQQVIDFGPIFILDFGAGYDLTKLPHN